MNEIPWESPARPERKQTAVVTVRMPREAHDRLTEAAHDHRVSLNTFVLTAIDRLIEECKEVSNG